MHATPSQRLLKCWFALAAGFCIAAGALLTSALAQDTGPRIQCSIHQGPCSVEMRGRTVELDISPKPVRAMEQLDFQVTIDGPSLSKAPYIDLGMPAMEMGPNRVELKKRTKTPGPAGG